MLGMSRTAAAADEANEPEPLPNESELRDLLADVLSDGEDGDAVLRELRTAQAELRSIFTSYSMERPLADDGAPDAPLPEAALVQPQFVDNKNDRAHATRPAVPAAPAGPRGLPLAAWQQLCTDTGIDGQIDGAFARSAPPDDVSPCLAEVQFLAALVRLAHGLVGAEGAPDLARSLYTLLYECVLPFARRDASTTFSKILGSRSYLVRWARGLLPSLDPRTRARLQGERAPRRALPNWLAPSPVPVPATPTPPPPPFAVPTRCRSSRAPCAAPLPRGDPRLLLGLRRLMGAMAPAVAPGDAGGAAGVPTLGARDLLAALGASRRPTPRLLLLRQAHPPAHPLLGALGSARRRTRRTRRGRRRWKRRWRRPRRRFGRRRGQGWGRGGQRVALGLVYPRAGQARVGGPRQGMQTLVEEARLRAHAAPADALARAGCDRDLPRVPRGARQALVLARQRQLGRGRRARTDPPTRWPTPVHHQSTSPRTSPPPVHHHPPVHAPVRHQSTSPPSGLPVSGLCPLPGMPCPLAPCP